MTDPAQSALRALIAHCLPAAYQYDQDSYALLTCTMVRVSLEHGNSPLSARAYGSFAALIVSALKLYDEGYRFAKLGVDLAHKLNDPSVLSGVYFLWAMFASHWKQPIDESVDLYRQSIQYGLQSGDHLHAGYSAARRFSHLQFRGMPLDELRDEGKSALELLQRIGDATNTEFVAPRMRLIDWLRGERRHGDTLGATTTTRPPAPRSSRRAAIARSNTTGSCSSRFCVTTRATSSGRCTSRRSPRSWCRSRLVS